MVFYLSLFFLHGASSSFPPITLLSSLFALLLSFTSLSHFTFSPVCTHVQILRDLGPFSLSYSPPRGKPFPGVSKSEITTHSGHRVALDYCINEQLYLFLFPLHSNLLFINGKSIHQTILSHQHGLPG